jgi:hypothetical protein
MRVLMGGLEVPFSSDVNVGDILMKLNENGSTVQNDSDDDDVVSNKLGNDAAGKKRKRKRGKAV